MKKNNRVGDAAVLMLFCVFIMSVFTSLVLGVGSYQNIIEASKHGEDKRLCLSYIWTKVKTGDELGYVYAGVFNELPALFIDEELDGVLHHTVIYHYDGWVRELFYETGFDFLPRDGIKIVKTESLMLEQLDSGLIKVSAGTESIVISPRSGRQMAAAGDTATGDAG